MALVVERFESIQYDGTNGAHIADEWLVSARVVSETDAGMVLEIDGWPSVQYEVANNAYVIRYWDRNFREVVPPEQYARRWVETPDPGTPETP